MVFFCGCSASPCQGEGREFESRHPLQTLFGKRRLSVGRGGVSHAIDWVKRQKRISGKGGDLSSVGGITPLNLRLVGTISMNLPTTKVDSSNTRLVL